MMRMPIIARVFGISCQISQPANSDIGTTV